jgi:uncharacterized protein YndB with AHSA1/START domain
MVILCTQVSSGVRTDYRSGPKYAQGLETIQMMSNTCRQQAFINAPLDTVWELASDPDRQTEWWPDTIVFECIDGEFEQGCHVRNIQKRPWPMSDLETTLEVDKMVPGKELMIRCMDTGTYTRSVLTEGQGGTFVEMEAGNDPTNLSTRMQVAVAGKRLFRHWVETALERLRGAAEASPAPR